MIFMAVLSTDSFGGRDQGACPSEESSSGAPRCHSASVQGACGHCASAMEQMNQGAGAKEPLRLGQVVLVFFLPLACAVAMVITAIRFLPKLAEHPGYLALSALAVASSAIFLARIFTRRSETPKRG